MNSNNWNSLYGLYHGNHMVDSLTDTVFFSDLLPERCPELYQSLDKILNENGILILRYPHFVGMAATSGDA